MKTDVLRRISFGQRVAEDERDALISYFVETEQWRRIFAGDVDIVSGPKGSGKSAIYFLLQAREDTLFDRGIVLTLAENPRGAPAFRDLVTDPPTGEEEFRALWKLYFLTLAADKLREYEIRGDDANDVTRSLEEARLLDPGASLSRKIQSCLKYIRSLLNVEAIEAGIQFQPETLQPVGVTGKITIREPSPEEQNLGFRSIDELFRRTDRAFGGVGMTLWIVIDRLDVAFDETPKLEQNALRALFRAYVDLLGLTNIFFKVFLRDDIWRRITESGFREASHITRTITITWDEKSLLNLIIRRAVQNTDACTYYRVGAAEVLQSLAAQQQLFYRIFPPQVDVGPNKPQTLAWMIGRTRDGSNRTAPRELIHLLEASRETELKRQEIGVDPPPGEALISAGSVKSALPEVSKVRLEQTLYAEYPETKVRIELLRGEKTEQSLSTLVNAWKCDGPSAAACAQKLSEVGFFEQRGSRESPTFWVPFLYRSALDMVQGAAE